MNPIISKEKSKYDDLLPKVVSDYVELPSQGMFYKSKIDKVMVEYMTATDEQYLLSESYIKNGTSFELLLKNKIKDSNFFEQMNIDDLLVGDYDAILLFLRRFAYGDDYKVIVTDTNGMQYEDTVDLSTLKFKEIEETQENLFLFSLPLTKQDVTFKLLTYGQRKALNTRIEKLNKFKTDNTSVYENQERIIAQIDSIAGETDRAFIEKYVKLMPPRDALALREYMLKVEPSLDYNYEFVGKFTGDFFRQKIAIGPEIFYPRS